MTWITTQSGRTIDFVNPDPDQIVLMDIAVSLSRVARFGGHSPVKVGQHILEVHHLMLRRANEEELTFSIKELHEIALIALLHDFPEYVVGDAMTPFKRLLDPAFETIETRLLNTMLVKWDLVDAYNKWHDLLKWADQEAVQQEAARFKLDGWYLTEELDQTKVPNRWVPEDKTINLVAELITEENLQSLVTAVFIRHMILSGRAALLSPFWLKHATDGAADEGMTVEEFVGEKITDDSLFTDHPGFM